MDIATMKIKPLLSCLALFSLPLLSGCSTMGKAADDFWNLDVRGPQPVEASTSRAAPLLVPPDYALAPAQSGAPRTQEAGGQEQVLDALYGGPATRSASERAVSTAAGTSEAGIRSSVGDPATVTVNKGSVTRDIIAAPEGDGQSAQAAIPG
jgi:hypothetical protein